MQERNQERQAQDQLCKAKLSIRRIPISEIELAEVVDSYTVQRVWKVYIKTLYLAHSFGNWYER
jgi:hypothetical protein